MAAACPTLMSVLAEVGDFRKRRGIRHPLAAILGLAVAATLCGYKSYAAMAEWGQLYGEELARALGFTRPKTPCVGTFHRVFRHLDLPLLEAKLNEWAEQCLASLPPAPGELEALAGDGKTLRGSRKQGALAVHLLSVLSQRLGLTLAQSAVDDKTNEITAMKAVIQDLVLTGRVLTMDALLCQRAIAQLILEKGGTTS